MSDSSNRGRAADWTPQDDWGGRGPQQPARGQRRDPREAAQPAWEPQPRAPRGGQPWAEDPRDARDQRTRRGGNPWDDDQRGGYDDQRGRGDGRGYDDRRGSAPYPGEEDGRRGAPGGRRAALTATEALPEGRAASRRAAAGGTRSARAGTGQPSDRRARVVTSGLSGAVASLLVALMISVLSSGGHAKSIAGISLNTKLFEFTAVGVPLTLAVIAGALSWRRIQPLGLTWGFGAVAGASWLALLWMAQVEGVIPHLPPFLTVPVLVGGAFAAGAALTDESTTSTGRYACLAAVVASHIGIVAIVVKIVLA